MQPAEINKLIKEILNQPTNFDEADIKNALLLITTSNIDFELASALCLKCFHHESLTMRIRSIMATGNIAQFYERLVNDELYNGICEIYKNKTHPLYRYANDALNDVKKFLKIPKPGLINKDNLDTQGNGCMLSKEAALELCNKLKELIDKAIFFEDKELICEGNTVCQPPRLLNHLCPNRIEPL